MASKSAKAVDQTQRERRIAPRIRVPSIKLRCDGELYSVEDWSWAGCRILSYKGNTRPGCTIFVELILFVDHDLEGLPAVADVVRFEPDNGNELALHFKELRPRDFMSYCTSVGKYLVAEVDRASD